MLEKEIERKLKEPIRKLGGMCLKFETPGFTGVPDRIILLPGGKAVFVEMKQPGKNERKRQAYVQSQIKALGFTVYSTVDSEAKIHDIVNACKKAIEGICDESL